MEGGTNLSKMVSCSGFMFKQFSVIATWGMGVGWGGGMGLGGSPKKVQLCIPELCELVTLLVLPPLYRHPVIGGDVKLSYGYNTSTCISNIIYEKSVWGFIAKKRHWYRYQRVLSTKHKGFWYNLNGTGSKVFTHPMWPLHLREILWQSWLSFT